MYTQMFKMCVICKLYQVTTLQLFPEVVPGLTFQLVSVADSLESCRC